VASEFFLIAAHSIRHVGFTLGMRNGRSSPQRGVVSRWSPHGTTIARPLLVHVEKERIELPPETDAVDELCKSSFGVA